MLTGACPGCSMPDRHQYRRWVQSGMDFRRSLPYMRAPQETGYREEGRLCGLQGHRRLT